MVRSVALKELFKSACWRSRLPKEAGLYTGVYDTIVPNWSLMPRHIWLVKVVALSQVSFLGRPKFLTQPSMKALAMASELASLSGNASSQRDVRHTRVSKYLCPSEMGIGPTISHMTSSNLAGNTGRESKGGIIVFFGFERMQGLHWLTYVAISDFISGQ